MEVVKAATAAITVLEVGITLAVGATILLSSNSHSMDSMAKMAKMGNTVSMDNTLKTLGRVSSQCIMQIQTILVTLINTILTNDFHSSIDNVQIALKGGFDGYQALYYY